MVTTFEISICDFQSNYHSRLVSTTTNFYLSRHILLDPRDSIVIHKVIISPFYCVHLITLSGIIYHWYVPLTRYAKLRAAHTPGMPGTFFPIPQVSDPNMDHGTCVTHVPWCIQGSLTSGFLWSRWRGNVPGHPSTCATRNFAYLVRGPWGHYVFIYGILV